MITYTVPSFFPVFIGLVLSQNVFSFSEFLLKEKCAQLRIKINA